MARVVTDTDRVMLRSVSKIRRAIEDLPAPEGEDRTSISPRLLM